MVKAVTTITPHRISFAGGGTDIAKFYEEYGGKILSTTIDKYLYVTVKKHSPLFEEQYRICYSKTERANSLENIENEIARECIRLVPQSSPLYISTVSDIHSSSGLGSSSSFAVGLLYALHVLRGEKVSAGQLAEEACKVEIEILNKPIGKQDQYAAAYGGLNHFKIDKKGSVNVEHILPDKEQLDKLFDSIMLFWTGIQRKSEDVLNDQLDSIEKKYETLIFMKDLVKECTNLLSSKTYDPKIFGGLLHSAWLAKKSLANSISNTRIDSYYNIALSNGAYGGKIAGAGGGGFLMLICDPNKKEHLKNLLTPLRHVPISYEPRGSEIGYLASE